MNKDMLKENKIHGDVMFPFSEYSMEYESGGNILDCHWHNELEFLLITKGKATFQIGTSYYEVSEGEAIFINSGEIHSGYTMDNSSCNFFAIVFSTDLLYNNGTYDIIQGKYMEPILKRKYDIPVHIKGENEWDKDLLAYLHKIKEITALKSHTYELLVKANLYIIFSIILSNCNLSLSGDIGMNDYKTERLKQVLEFIHANYNKKITINELAALQNMSEGHFCRFFKQMVRKTPIEYINSYRVNKAARLIENTTLRIIDIAIEVGFDNCSYFISLFKQYMKCTPSMYRSKVKVMAAI